MACSICGVIDNSDAVSNSIYGYGSDIICDACRFWNGNYKKEPVSQSKVNEQNENIHNKNMLKKK